jgi:hypothetical protein
MTIEVYPNLEDPSTIEIYQEFRKSKREGIWALDLFNIQSQLNPAAQVQLNN